MPIKSKILQLSKKLEHMFYGVIKTARGHSGMNTISSIHSNVSGNKIGPLLCEEFASLVGKQYQLFFSQSLIADSYIRPWQNFSSSTTQNSVLDKT